MTNDTKPVAVTKEPDVGTARQLTGPLGTVIDLFDWMIGRHALTA